MKRLPAPGEVARIRRDALLIPAPVPAGRFWSVTLHDLDTRSEINTKAVHYGPGPAAFDGTWKPSDFHRT